MENKFFPKWMVQTLGVLLIIFIALLILTQIKIINGYPQKMQISAIGKVTAVPDLATVTLGVISQGTTPLEVKNSNNQKVNQIIHFIKQQNIDAGDIKTTGFYASPRYNYVNGQNNIIGYQADQTVTIRVKDINKSQTQLEKILDGAVNNGANQIQGITFGFLDPDKLKESARKLAIKNAKEKAYQLATEADLKLGKVLNVTEASTDSSNPITMNTVNFAAKSQSVAPNIEPGNQEVIESVSLIFEVY